MKKEQPVYTIERVFLGKIKPDEFVSNIVKKHGKNIDIYIGCDYEKPLKKL